MIFPFIDEELIPEKESYLPREYGVDFETGNLTGKIVEGVEALKVWAWLALQTPSNRYYIYSWYYGQEYDSMIGQGFSKSYTATELERITADCLTVNPYITGIYDFTCEAVGDHVYLSFRIETEFGDTEVSTNV